MSRPVRAPTGCLPHATAHDKRPPACRPPESLFPRHFKWGNWRGNNFSTGRVSYWKHATYLFDGKTCSNCSNVNAKLKREPRWQCPSYGMNHDRNINAAVNLRELLTLPPGSGVKLRDGKALTVGTPHGETSPDQRACPRHTTVHQTGQKTGQSSFQQAVSYSEIPLKSSESGKTAIPPSRNPAHHFRRLFDDSNALFVLNSVHTFGYNGTYPNIRACYDAFTNRSENRSEKRPGIGSWQAIPW